ncbi:MAG: hypothetical protein Q8O88_05215 [bacterium]|nr:hypothetical protein [bacterium]
MAMIMKGYNRQLLNALGINYAYFYVEDCSPIMFIMLDVGNALVNQAQLSVKQTKIVQKQLKRANLAKDAHDICKKICTFKFNKDFKASIEFRQCHCMCPLTHGYIYNSDGKEISSDVYYLSNGLIGSIEPVEISTIHVNDAIVALQQMQEAKLPWDEDDIKNKGLINTKCSRNSASGVIFDLTTDDDN